MQEIVNSKKFFERKKVIDIVKRLIELEKEFWEKGNHDNFGNYLHGKSDGCQKALEVIESNLDYDPEIHKLIDDSRE